MIHTNTRTNSSDRKGPDPMTHSRNATRPAAALAVLLASTALALTACGSDSGRAASAVSASTSGAIVTDSSTDLGSIIIGWGQQHSNTEITTPKPSDVTARCYGNGNNLAVDITAPHGWKIHATHGSQILTVENSDQHLAKADIDTTKEFLGAVKTVDWSKTDEVDIAATAKAPKQWNSPYGDSARFYASLHITCH